MEEKLTRDRVTELLHTQGPYGFVADSVKLIKEWTDRGDGCAVYRNEDIGHPEMGRLQFVSYGSAAAFLETDRPPWRLPDTTDQINWRYVLIGTYRKELR